MTRELQAHAKTRVVLTVDMEPSIAGAFQGNPAYMPLIHEPVAGEVHGRSEALGFLITTLTNHRLVASFFVETVHTRYFAATIMGGYVERLLQAGQDVQLHLHPCWLAFEQGSSSLPSGLTDNCQDLETGRLAEIIWEGVNQIAAWTGTRPSCMRTGNFSSSHSVFEAMSQVGVKHSSNICLAAQRPREPKFAVTGGVHEFTGVRELPATCFFDVGPIGRGRLRSMQVTALTAREQIGLLEAAHDCGNPVVVILTHPFEFLKKRDFRYTDLRPNRIVQNRFRCLCAFLDANRDRFEVVPLASAASAFDGPQKWTELKGNWLRAMVRAFENGTNDHLRFI